MSRGGLAGKVALITGGNSGIGEATARRFVAAGAHVAIAARDLDSSTRLVNDLNGSGAQARAYRCDVTDPADCEATVNAVVADFGQLDVLVNNAGVIYRDKTVTETTVQEWDLTFAVNTRGPFLMSKFAVPVMSRGGSIVNNASYFGLVGGRGVAAYAASKGALVLLTKAMALDHAADGIRVNCVCAGSVDTPMLRAEMADMGGEAAVRPGFEEKHPLGRIATADEVATAIEYLASPDAAFVTGTALSVDGGLTAG